MRSGPLFAPLRLAARRARARPWLFLFGLLSMVVVVGFVCSVALYATAMSDAMLLANLTRDGRSNYISMTNLPAPDAPLSMARYRDLDTVITRSGLAVDWLTTHHFTLDLALTRAAGGQSLGRASLDYYAGAARAVAVVAGAWPHRPDVQGGVQVVVDERVARAVGMRLGDRLRLHSEGSAPLPVVVSVVALYRPLLPTAAYWDSHSHADDLSPYLLIPDLRAFMAATAPASPTYFWLYQARVNDIHMQSAASIVDAVHRLVGRAPLLAPHTTVVTTLDADIASFMTSFGMLDLLLYALMAPIAGIIIYYIVVSAGLIRDEQWGEMLLLRSRGASRRQIGGMALADGLLLVVLALVVGPLIAVPVATGIGHTTGFLSFGTGLPFRFSVTTKLFVAAAAAAVLGSLAIVGPALLSTRHAMAVLLRERGRPNRRSMWQRLYLDAVLLILAAYGYWVVSRHGRAAPDDALALLSADPFVGLAPALLVVACALLAARALPLLSAGAARLAGQHGPASTTQALRSLARAPAGRLRWMILLALCIASGVFAAAVAGTVAANADDQAHYDAGGALRFEEIDDARKAYSALPRAWHLALPGVRDATIAARLAAPFATLSTEGAPTADLLAVDPSSMADVVWSRDDFSTTPLPTLLRKITSGGPGVIISENLARATGLRTGDGFQMTLADGHTLSCVVVGLARYFPTLDPAHSPFVVLSLTTLLRVDPTVQVGEAWLRTGPSAADLDAVTTAARRAAATRHEPRTLLDHRSHAAPFVPKDNLLQAGLYGVATVGFLVATLLSLIGFLAHSLLSLRRRMDEFSVLRALGFSTRQVGLALLTEQLLLVGAGILCGLVGGTAAAWLFLPYLPVVGAPTPPFLVSIPWAAIASYLLAVAFVFVVALGASAWLISRAEIGRVLRLGAT